MASLPFMSGLRSQAGAAVLLAFITLAGTSPPPAAAQAGGPPPDEAKAAGRDPHFFVPRDDQIHDYFPGMDAISAPAGAKPQDATTDQLLDQKGGNRDPRVVRPPDLTPQEVL